MKTLYNYPYKGMRLLLLILVAISGCKKYEAPSIYPSSITIYNAVSDRNQIFRTYFHDSEPNIYRTLNQLGSSYGLPYTYNEPTLHLKLYDIIDTLGKDPYKYQFEMNLRPGGIYSAYVYGTQGNYNHLFLEDTYPKRYIEDSSTYFRFANFIHERAVDIVMTLPTVQVIETNVAFTGVTDFHKFPCNISIMDYEFKFVDHLTKDTLHSKTILNVHPANLNRMVNLFGISTVLVNGISDGVNSDVNSSIYKPL
jgi:hypothetical protein